MRPVFVAGNWKMNLNRASAVAWASQVASRLAAHARLKVAVFPPFPYLECVGQVLKQTPVELGAQNLNAESRGTFTGEVSGPMLVDMGCRYVIIGHSERRHLLGEGEQSVRRKLLAALDAGLTPILCVGELLEERDDGRTRDVVTAQLFSATAGLDSQQVGQMVVAYEPVWAIGTGRNATPEQAEEVQSHIRKMLAERYNASLADRAVIQYGGSVKGANAGELLDQPNVDGLLVGGASLSADEFLGILEAARRVAGG